MNDLTLLAPAPKAAVKRFTWDDVLAMSAAGMFAETERVELIGGEIVVMPEEGPLHVDALEALRRWLERILQPEFEVCCRGPLALPGATVTVPDLAVYRRGFRARDMVAANVQLLIEVSDTTLNRDQRRKRPLYAEAGIVEFWIADPRSQQIRVHRDPAEGEWQTVQTFGPGQAVAPLIAPQAAFAVDDLPNEAH